MSENKSVLQDKVIMVVDDEPGMLNLIDLIVSDHGGSIVRLANGKEALDYYDGHHPNVDLVISDIVMPDINGLKVLSTIIKKKDDQKILLMSGHVEEAGVEYLVKTKLHVDYIHKPFTDDEFINKVLSYWKG